MPYAARRVLLLLLVAAALSAGAASVSAVRAEDFAGDVPDRVWIDVGGAFNDVSTDVAIRGPNGVGATLNLEDIFDMPGHKTTARMMGTVRISEKRRYMDFGYVSIDRWGSRVLDPNESITWGDYTIDGGAAVRARFSTQFAYAAYRYDFLHEDKIRISGNAGMTWMRFIVGVSAEGSVTDPTGTQVGEFSKEVSQGAPVPEIGLNLDWALTDRLVVRTYSRFFKISVSSFKGGLNENGIHLNWYIVKNFGLAVGYDRTDLDIKELKVGDGNIMKAGYVVNGIGLYANLAF
jgi:hypothetical protein